MEPDTVAFYPLSAVLAHFQLGKDFKEYLHDDFPWGKLDYSLLDYEVLVEIMAEFLYDSAEHLKAQYASEFGVDAYIDLES